MTTYEQGTSVTLEATWESAITDVRLTIRPPDGVLAVLELPDVEQDSPTSFHYDVVGDQAGDWYWLWEALAPGVGPREGSFTIDPNRTTEQGATDAADLRTLIPRVRRTLEGPQATSALADASVLTDAEILAAIADGVSSFLLYGGEASRGFTLNVTDRDAYYLAPIAWSIDPVLDDARATAIVAQVALDVYFHQVKAMKVMERIGDEASTWEYQLSASLVRDQLKALQEARDRAIAVLTTADTPLDSYVSFLGSRDQRVLLHIGQDWIGPPEL